MIKAGLRFFYLLVFLCFGLIRFGFTQEFLVFQQEPHRFIPEKLVDLEHLSADIRIDPFNQLVAGKVELLFRQTRSDVDSLVLLAPDFQIGRLLLDDANASWKLSGKNLIVQLPSETKRGATHSLYLEYLVKPESELYFVGWDDTTQIMRRQIWAHRPYNWLPFANDRLTMDLYITFDSRYQVFSNGVRENVEHFDTGLSRWHYKMYRTHPFFSTALVIGKYKYKQSLTKKGLPLELWYYPDRENHFDATYQHMNEMIAFCEDEFGIGYPYELYRQAPVANYLYAGMETTTSTIFGDYLHIDERAFWERNYVNVNIHELVHQWFGNYISHLRPADVWITESFATYYAKRFEKQLYGEDYYQWERIKETRIALDASSQDNYAVASSLGGGARWYQKGSLVLDMLRDEMGDEDFTKSITAYLKKFAYKESWTPDLKKTIYETTGRSMDWFFEQWIERGGEPYFQIDYSRKMDSLILEIRQLQDIKPEMPLFVTKPIIEIHFEDESFDRFQFINQTQYQRIERFYPESKQLAYVLFDPGDRILKRQEFNRPTNLLINQLLQAQLMIDRYEALFDLRKFPVEEKRTALLQAGSKADFHLIKSEIIDQLSADQYDDSKMFIINCLTDTSVFVRRAAINAMQEHHSAGVVELEKLLSDISYSNQELALRKLARLNPDRLPDYLSLIDTATGFPGLNVKIAQLELLAQSGDEKAFKLLTNFSGNQYEFRTRMNAIKALSRLNSINETIANNLIEAAVHWNFRLSPVALEALQEFYADENNWVLIADQLKKSNLTREQQVELEQKLTAEPLTH